MITEQLLREIQDCDDESTCDALCKQFDYSGFSFTLCCLISASISLILTRKFAARMTERKWQ